MRDDMTPDVVGAVSTSAITTAWLLRLEFQTETMFLWTGVGSIQPTGTAETLLNDNTFNSISSDGVVTDLGENTFTQSGSDELEISLSIPSEPSVELAAAAVYRNEYQARPAYIWRALMIPQGDPLAKPVWAFRRIRSGKMDKLEISYDGQSHTFKMTIESHQSNISAASNQTYLNQRTYDPADSSQDYAVSIANGDPAPAKTNFVTAGGSTMLADKYGNEIGSAAIS